MPSKFRIPPHFNDRDLTMDVRLTAIYSNRANGTQRSNMSGIETIDVSFYKDNIGFGITQVDIDVNTSLQPVIKITFKDLYSATSVGGEFNRDGIDFSGLFAWPPPKFKFQFKGFLGNSVSWLLNLKQYSIAANTSDGSRIITAEFVPNQFGFFADIPYLYLRSIKKLRETLGDPLQEGEVTTFDLIEIGNKVNDISAAIDEEYQADIENLTFASSDLSRAVIDESIVAGEEFTVANRSRENTGEDINEFLPILVPKKIGTQAITAEELSELEAGNGREAVNFMLACNTTVGGRYMEEVRQNSELRNQSISFYATDDAGRRTQFRRVSSQLNQAIIRNIDTVEQFKQAQLFVESEGRIGDLSISNVIEAIARDTGYLMGAILDYGLLGEENNYEARSNDRNLIGINYPLKESDDGEQNERPAFGDYGIEIENEGEMWFVRTFIDAVIESITRDEEDTLLPSFGQRNRNRIANRITNLEVLYPNPYKPFPDQIMRTAIIRGGIGSFLTGSDDPNNPGRGQLGELRELAKKDFDNVKPVLSQVISDGRQQELKDLCEFFSSLWNDDADEFSESIEIDDRDIDGFTNAARIQEYRKASYQFRGRADDDPVVLGDILDRLFPANNITGVDTTTYTSRMVYLNNNVYFNPFVLDQSLKYIVFDVSRDADRVLAEFPAADYDEDTNFAEGAFEIKYADGQSDNLPDAVTNFGLNSLNASIGSDGLVYSWSKLRSFTPEFDRQLSSTEIRQEFAFTNPFKAAENPEAVEPDEQDEFTFVYRNDPTNSTYAAMPLSNPNNFDANYNGRIFDLFGTSLPARAQRAYIDTLARLILEELNSIENEIARKRGTLINRFTNAEDDIYKQFHALYQQWSSMIPDGETANGTLRNRFQQDFGSYHFDYNDEGERTQLRNLIGTEANTAFVYQFPLQSIQQNAAPSVNIKDAIVSIDPLRQGSTDANTTVLNVIQNLCTKNNFTFIPIPGNPGYDSADQILSPQPASVSNSIFNVFHVMFLPTPESRTQFSNITNQSKLVQNVNDLNPQIEGFLVRYGSPDNQIYKSLDVDTVDNKVTAESIINLQALVDNNTQTKRVTKDCSMLSVLAGRSYKSKLGMLGNAQIFPTQFYFIERSPLFGGLYQIMSVSHSITPNNFETNFEGIRMRFAGSNYIAVLPITRNDFVGFQERFGFGTEGATETQPTTTTRQVKSETDSFEEAAYPEDIVVPETQPNIEEIGDLIIDRSHRLNSNEYFKQEFDKRMIFLHHTAGGAKAENSIAWWNGGGAGRIGTSYVIGREDGNRVFEAFDPKYWAYHLGLGSNGNSHALDKQSIGIELCAYGGLVRVGDEFQVAAGAAKGRVIPTDEVIDLKREFRGYRYYQKYTDSQLQAMEKLLDKLVEDFGINVQASFSEDFFEYDRVVAKNVTDGIYTHCTVRQTGKWDLYPDRRVLQILRRVSQKSSQNSV